MTQKQRRTSALIVTFALIIMLSIIGIQLFAANAESTMVIAIILLPLVTLGAGIFQKKLRISLGNLWQEPDANLDERQQAVRNHSYRLSARILLITSVVMGISTAVTKQSMSLSDAHSYNMLFWFFICLIVLQTWLPRFLLAWLEPEPFSPEEATN